MNKTIITELKRAREIMGLNVGELLNEQSPTKLLGKILNTFSRTTLPKEAAEKLAIRLSKLLSKSEGTALTNVFDRMNSNIVLGPNGGKYLVSATGTNFPFSNIERIISLVASGKFGMKTGEGFFTWTAETIKAERERYQDALRAGLKIIQKDLPEIK